MSDIACALPTREQFFEQVGSTFGTTLPDGRRADLILARLEDHVSTATHQNFSLIFHGPVDMPREQGIFALTNEAIGTMDLFLVPISANTDELELEAVFNLVTPREQATVKSAEV